ncbi:phospholipase effector Tle1 domain-containing protein [Siccirubricoccus deserti]
MFPLAAGGRCICNAASRRRLAGSGCRSRNIPCRSCTCRQAVFSGAAGGRHCPRPVGMVGRPARRARLRPMPWPGLAPVRGAALPPAAADVLDRDGDRRIGPVHRDGCGRPVARTARRRRCRLGRLERASFAGGGRSGGSPGRRLGPGLRAPHHSRHRRGIPAPAHPVRTGWRRTGCARSSAGECRAGPRPAARGGRRIVICCDGTGNRPDDEEEGLPATTNVWKIHHGLVCDDTQTSWYDPGVATDTSSTAAEAAFAPRA